MQKYPVDLPIPKKYFNALVIVFFILSSTVSIASYYYYATHSIYDYYSMNREDAIIKLQETFKQFKQMSGKEFHNLWNTYFHDATYTLGGNGDNNKWDCSNSLCYVLKLLGANIPHSSTKDLTKLLTEKSHFRENINDCRLFDIILFHKDRAGIGHIGIIEYIDNTTIRYCDMNALTGPGYNSTYFNNPRIYGIYPITLEMWFGDLLKRE